MRATQRNYTSFDEFEREELKAGSGPGWSFDRFIQEVTVEGEEFNFAEGLFDAADEDDEDEDDDDA